MYFGPKEKNTYKTNFKFSYVSVLDSLQLQSLLQPRVSLPAIDINGRRVWLFYNAIGAVAQCPYNWGVGSAFHLMKIHISVVEAGKFPLSGGDSSTR